MEKDPSEYQYYGGWGLGIIGVSGSCKVTVKVLHPFVKPKFVWDERTTKTKIKTVSR